MPRGNTYTEEHINFLREYGPGHTLTEIWEEFFDKFEMDISKASIQYLVQRYSIPHISRNGLTSKVTKNRGSEQIKYKRTQVRGSEEIFNLMEDACSLFGLKKYEFCNQAITTFLKNNNSISRDLRSKKYPKKSKYINVDIPVSLEEAVKETAIKNGCSISILIVQALINYGVSKLPGKLDSFKHVITTNSNNLTIPISTTNEPKSNLERHYWTKQEIEYVRSLAPTNTFNSLLNKCNKEFNFIVTEASLRTQMSRNHIYTGIKEIHNKKSGKNNNTNTTKSKNQKYYVDGMEELKFNPDKNEKLNAQEFTSKEETKHKIDIQNEKLLNKDLNTMNIVSELSSSKAETNKMDSNLNDAQDNNNKDNISPTKSTIIKKERELPKIMDKKYIIPQELPKIIERVRKLTSASRFEVSDCAVRYYLSKKWHVDKRLKIAKYHDTLWLNTKFVQPVVITFEDLNRLDKVAKEFNCKISTVILQAYFDYSSKIFEDCGIEFNYVFESDLNR